MRADFGSEPARGPGDDARAYALAAQAGERQRALVASIGGEAGAPGAGKSGTAVETVSAAGGMRGALDALRGKEPAGGVLDKVA